jgi:hypothetical protein
LGFLEAAGWQMVAGERAALIGVLSDMRPRLAIEIGTADGGSLRCLSGHCDFVHSFDLHRHDDLSQLGNVELHTGDSHELLPALLRTLEADGCSVDFALVDGDHTAGGVRRDVEDLLSSTAVRRSVIVAHDASNEEVRAGLESVDYGRFAKVTVVDLDFVGGHLSRHGPFANQLWGGLALVVADQDRFGGAASFGRSDTHAAFEVMRRGATTMADASFERR